MLAQRAASEGPRWTRAAGIIPATPYEVIVSFAALLDSLFEQLCPRCTPLSEARGLAELWLSLRASNELPFYTARFQARQRHIFTWYSVESHRAAPIAASRERAHSEERALGAGGKRTVLFQHPYTFTKSLSS